MSPVEPALRGVLVTALMVLIGATATFQFVVFPEMRKRGIDAGRAERVAVRLVGWSLVAALSSATGLALFRAASAPQPVDPLRWTLVTEPGRAWVVQSGAILALGGATAIRSRRPERLRLRYWLGSVLGGSLLALLALCWRSHSTAVSDASTAILMKFGHMTGAALWVGGLVVVAALPSLLPEEWHRDLSRVAAGLIRRFSMVAVAGVTLAFATGTVIVAWHVPAVDALHSTTYGIVLSIKIALVLVAAGLGGLNRVVLHRRILRAADGTDDGGLARRLPGLLVYGRPAGPDPRRAVEWFVRSVRVELAVLIVVLLVSVFLTAALTPSYELLSAKSGVPLTFVSRVAEQTLVQRPAERAVTTGFTALLRFGALGIAVTGALALGYEVGEFTAHER
ncbi:copper resistance D family protein [Halegenticoccus soli]|uniref:copper resistance D family protein n=1 Tax=Halegenticoccus soli TaxID=1985678 RepID=UPI000C6D1195|nr:CopD family protein [Halegenticoccus soli]